jgi:hypothetical protein
LGCERFHGSGQRRGIHETAGDLQMISQLKTVGHRWINQNFELIEALADTGNGLVDLWEASPVRLECNQPNTDDIIDALFPGNPLLCCGWNRHRFDTRARTRWYKLHDLQFSCRIQWQHHAA